MTFKSSLYASLLALHIAVAQGACGGGLRRFPLAEPLTHDPDQQPFEPMPEAYYSGLVWDGADQSLFRPLAWFFAVDPGGEAVNVNALDEVPDSAWFENRLGARPLSVEDIVRGPCGDAPPLDPAGPWTVVGAKPNGENPGFIISAQDERRYLLKFDGLKQQPRATAADVIGTRVYWAAGYHTPCNSLVHFDRTILRISDKARAEDEDGHEVPLAEHHLDVIFGKATRLGDGRYRANASRFLPGRPLGPWTYSGLRDDDPNDVVPHEDRREIRAASVLASWLNHFDSREQNTLDMWITVGGADSKRGFIRHHYIDFGDCFGSLWEWDALSRRWGHSYLLDYAHIGGDLLSLGLVSRPWDRNAYGPAGEVWGYYDVEPFDPGDWRNEYPNPAFSRLTDRDAAWMARIMVGFSDEVVRALVATGEIADERARAELERILIGRRNKILTHWFSKLSALGQVSIVQSHNSAALCARDLGLVGGVYLPEERTYTADAWIGLELRQIWAGLGVDRVDGDRVCVQLPSDPAASAAHPSYLLVDLRADTAGAPGLPLRAHLYQTGPLAFRLVGLERPKHPSPPSP